MTREALNAVCPMAGQVQLPTPTQRSARSNASQLFKKTNSCVRYHWHRLICTTDALCHLACASPWVGLPCQAASSRRRRAGVQGRAPEGGPGKVAGSQGPEAGGRGPRGWGAGYRGPRGREAAPGGRGPGARNRGRQNCSPPRFFA